MGIFGAIAEGVVAIKYTANVDEAVAAVKGLSGEQKKAAKQAVEAHKQEREVFKKKVEEFGKGAAIIGGALLVARNGLQAYREESRLMAGAAGVDIGELSDAYDGLRTRTELLTLAQAGHQGAWKLTTAQIENVIGGMRALEKKGFDSTEVFERFTDVIKKGKLEGLDDFGLSLKATGNQTDDLKVLMNALGREVLDVGGNFDKAGDAATRAMARMNDGLTNLRTSVGWLTDKFLGLGVAIGDALGKAVFGDLPTDVGTGGRADVYTDAFARLGGGARLDGTRSRGAFAQVTGADSWFTFADRKLFKGATDADRLAGRTLSTFKDALNKGIQNWGPLATTSPEEFAAIVAGLPEDWRLVDAGLAASVDAMQAKLQTRFNKVGVDAAQGILTGFKNALSKNRADVARSRGGGRGRAANDNLGPGLFFGAVDTVTGAVERLAGLEDARAAGAAASQARLDALGNAGMQSDFADARDALAKMQEEFAGVTRAAELNKADEESFLARTFGPLEEFDQYAAGFATLKGAVQDGFAAWISGAESVGTAIRKSIAKSLAGYAIEMAGMALVAGAHGIFHLTNPATAAQGAGELFAAAKYSAAALALAGLAKLASPSGDSNASASAGAGSATGGRGGRSQDHRGEGGGAWRPGANNGGPVILGDAFDDGSRRYRERQVAAAMARTSTVYQPPRGAAA
jgi:hypothetical protein